MELKATILADLDRLEKLTPTKPRTTPVRDADANHQNIGNGAAHSVTVGPNTKSFVHATSAVQPVSLESAARH